MVDTAFQKDLFDPYKFRMPVHIVGCGGIGSRIAEALVRMGLGMAHNLIFLYDDDVFEAHNLANQFAHRKLLGKPKVIGVKQQLRAINPRANIVARQLRVDEKEKVKLTGVVFICVDSMESRHFLMEKCLEDNNRVRCVIETRMDAGVGISHCFDSNNHQHSECWWLYWYSDDETENMQGCGGAQSIISAVFGTTTLALRQFEQFARKRNTVDIPNRSYHDFDSGHVRHEYWDTCSK